MQTGATSHVAWLRQPTRAYVWCISVAKQVNKKQVNTCGTWHLHTSACNVCCRLGRSLRTTHQAAHSLCTLVGLQLCSSCARRLPASSGRLLRLSTAVTQKKLCGTTVPVTASSCSRSWKAWLQQLSRLHNHSSFANYTHQCECHRGVQA